MTIRSLFDKEGFPLHEGKNLTYLYGLSDFWEYIYSNHEQINLLLEGESIKLSDVYSKFLQLTSSLSLEDIQTTIGSQIELVLIKDTDHNSLSSVSPYAYTLPENILSTRFIANRPLFPTSLLEENVHYYISQDGTEIYFHKDISQLKLPKRVLSDGVIEYSLWFIDCEIDSELIVKNYSQLVSVSPEASTENFKNFVYGLFYLYSHGPNLEQLRKGMNLALGIPLAREEETVLDIRKYFETGDWIVTTDFNSYLIPYGIEPIVSVGDALVTSQELAQWVEVKDYFHDGDWWLNLQIPRSIMPYIPDGHSDSYAKENTYAYKLMDEYLKHHTFLVNVKVINFKNIQRFEELIDIINRAKPTYTTPIYIWSVRVEETLEFSESMSLTGNFSICDTVTGSMERFYRNNSTNPLHRGCSLHTRYTVPHYVVGLTGNDPLINGNPRPLDNGTVYGFIAPDKMYKGDSGQPGDGGETDTERGWYRVFFGNRSPHNHRMTRGLVNFNRGQTYGTATGTDYVTFSSCEGEPDTTIWSELQEYRLIPLYITTKYDVENKYTSLGLSCPTDHSWRLFPFDKSQAINATPIGDSSSTENTANNLLINNFSLLFSRGAEIHHVGPEFHNRWKNDTYTPSVSDLTDYDYLFFIRITDYSVGVYWVTLNQDLQIPPYFLGLESDQLKMSFSAKIFRGGAAQNTPYYLCRGGSYATNVTAAINVDGVNSVTEAITVQNAEYSDLLNTTVTVDRNNGTTLHVRKERL